MKIPLLDQAMHVATAISAVKIKGARLQTTAEGVVIKRQGWPALLLTYEAAREYANEVAEAEQWS